MLLGKLKLQKWHLRVPSKARNFFLFGEVCTLGCLSSGVVTPPPVSLLCGKSSLRDYGLGMVAA